MDGERHAIPFARIHRLHAIDPPERSFDGPYAETKEQLGGYYLVQARDLNEAIQVAARIPGARLGAVEVRPIMTDSEAGTMPPEELSSPAIR